MNDSSSHALDEFMNSLPPSVEDAAMAAAPLLARGLDWEIHAVEDRSAETLEAVSADLGIDA